MNSADFIGVATLGHSKTVPRLSQLLSVTLKQSQGTWGRSLKQDRLSQERTWIRLGLGRWVGEGSSVKVYSYHHVTACPNSPPLVMTHDPIFTKSFFLAINYLKGFS